MFLSHREMMVTVKYSWVCIVKFVYRKGHKVKKACIEMNKKQSLEICSTEYMNIGHE